APKSDSAAAAYFSAENNVKNGDLQPVPPHLHNGSPDYVYPHDDPRHWVAQKYLLEPRRFYNPALTGMEPALRARLARFWRRFRDENA
ncbi:MAG: replication-associated recombination protein A, partial [Pyramidobacter sp.]|nr:replication-associated recombination protein A [Pyramidobacter sp.]